MKQKERIDLVLRKLYDLRDDHGSHTLTSIMKELGIYESDTDMRRLATRLEDERLATSTDMRQGLYMEISTYGIDYYEENLSGTMKQSEKTDRILQWLYERRHKDGQLQKIEDLMKSLGIFESRGEAERIAEDLLNAKLVTIHKTSDGAGLIGDITSNGVRYSEGDSFSHPGQPVASIVFQGDFYSTNAVVGNNISQVQQTATVTNEAAQLIRKLKEEIQSSPELSSEEKENLVGCVEDISEKVASKKAILPYQWGALLGNTANLSQVSALAIQLAQMFGFLPPTP